MQAIGLGVMISTALAIAGIIFARPLLAALGGSPWVLEHGVGYTRVMMGGVVSILLLFLIGLLRFGLPGGIIQAILLGLAGYFIPRFYLGWRQSQRLKAFNDQLGDTLVLMSNAQ